MKTIALTLALALVIVVTAGTSVEDRLRALENHTASRLRTLENHVTALEAENIALKADNVALKNTRIQEGLIGEIRMFGLEPCPGGWEEAKNAQGRIPVFRPTGGSALQYFGKPLKVNETYRLAPHDHPVTLKDPGHTHKLPIKKWYGGSDDDAGAGMDSKESLSSDLAKTGISVSVGDSTGDPYPLIYVVVCTPTGR
jgi:hypothetical protein